MKGKIVVLSLFIISLTLAQSQIGITSCCRNTTARNNFDACRLQGKSQVECAALSDCIIVRAGTACPSDNPIGPDLLGDVVNEYCKLGCTSSMCGALATLQDSDTSEIVNEAVETCTKACSTMCTKRSIPAIETA